MLPTAHRLLPITTTPPSPRAAVMDGLRTGGALELQRQCTHARLCSLRPLTYTAPTASPSLSTCRRLCCPLPQPLPHGRSPTVLGAAARRTFELCGARPNCSARSSRAPARALVVPRGHVDASSPLPSRDRQTPCSPTTRAYYASHRTFGLVSFWPVSVTTVRMPLSRLMCPPVFNAERPLPPSTPLTLHAPPSHSSGTVAK